jgi:hypothetical protein
MPWDKYHGLLEMLPSSLRAIGWRPTPADQTFWFVVHGMLQMNWRPPNANGASGDQLADEMLDGDNFCHIADS